MMGRSQKTEPKLFYHGVSLERRVPADHPLRRISKLIDFTFVRSRVEELYGVNGNVSVDPAVILKLMFLLIYEDLKSERALMEQLPLRMDWLWFCGYDLDDITPDHSVISKARRRWGQEVFDGFFNSVLSRCIEAGLVDGQTIHIDSSMIKGDVSKDKLQAQVHLVFQELNGRLDEPVEEPDTVWHKKHPVVVNSTDPDARLGRKNGQSVLGYKDHRVIDDKCGIVTASITTPANINDSLVMKDALREHEDNTGSQVKAVVADKGYGVIENYRYLKDIKALSCIPHKVHAKEGRFSYDDFCYDKKNDRYVCPAGQLLNRLGPDRDDQKVASYRCNPTICRQCQLRDKCMTGQTTGRSLQRNSDVKYIEWADRCLSRHERRRLLNRRKHKAEGSFADATNNHGFKHARWRGLVKMTIQNLLIAAAQNIRKLLHHTSGNSTNLATSAAKIAVQTALSLQNLLIKGRSCHLNLS
jgi:transposase/ribosomal protein S28E/S33